MKIRPITNNYDYNTCYNCGQTLFNGHMYTISFFKIRNLSPIQNDTVLCINCLFELQLRINDIFQLDNLTMLDGTDKPLVPVIAKDMIGIPEAVFDKLKLGKRVKAIKTCCLIYDIGLYYAKHLVNKWYADILKSNLEEDDIFLNDDDKMRYIKELRRSVKHSTEKLAKDPDLKLTNKERGRTENA